MHRYDPYFDFKINVSRSDRCGLYFTGSIFAIYLEEYFMLNIILSDYESYYPKFDLKINVGHSDIYFTVK